MNQDTILGDDHQLKKDGTLHRIDEHFEDGKESSSSSYDSSSCSSGEEEDEGGRSGSSASSSSTLEFESSSGSDIIDERLAEIERLHGNLSLFFFFFEPGWFWGGVKL